MHFSVEQETQLARLTSKTGADPEQLVKETVLRLIDEAASCRRPAPELPKWDLGAVGSLHRRDLYDGFRCASRRSDASDR